MIVYVVIHTTHLNELCVCGVNVFDTRESAYEYAKSMYERTKQSKKRDLMPISSVNKFQLYDRDEKFYETWEIFTRAILTDSK